MKNAVLFLIISLTILKTPMLVAQSSSDSKQKQDPHFILNLSAGIGYPRFSNSPLNVPGRWVAGMWGIQEHHLDSLYQNYSIDLGYLIGSGVSVGAGYEFLKIKGNGHYLWYYSGLSYSVPYRLNLPTHGVFVVADKRWSILKKPLKVEVHTEIKTGWYISYYKYYEKEVVRFLVTSPTEIFPSWQKGQWGTELVGGILVPANRHLAFGVDGGYRWLNIKNYDGIFPGQPSGQADFTGPTVRIRISTRF